MAKKMPGKVSECVAAGRVVCNWLLEHEQKQLAQEVAERILSLNRELGYLEDVFCFFCGSTKHDTSDHLYLEAKGDL